MLNVASMSGYLIDDLLVSTQDGEVSVHSTIAYIEKNSRNKDDYSATLYMELVFRRNLAAIALDHLHGGSKLYVEGRKLERNNAGVSKHYVDVQFIDIFDSVSQGSSSNSFSRSASSNDFKIEDENSDNEKVFDDSMYIEDEDGYRFKP